MASGIQRVLPQQFSAYQVTDSYIYNDSTWKTIACVAGAILVTLASFYLLSAGTTFALTLSTATITWAALSSEAPRDKARRLFATAEKSIQNEDFQLAIQSLEQAQRLDPQNHTLRAKILFNMAFSLSERNQQDDRNLALFYLQQTVPLNFSDHALRQCIELLTASIMLENSQQGGIV